MCRIFERNRFFGVLEHFFKVKLAKRRVFLMLNPCFYPLLQGVTKVPESKKAHFITLNKNWVNKC